MTILAKEEYFQVVNKTLPDLLVNVPAFTMEELGVEYLLHISDNPNIPEFIPTVPHRASKEQDHRLPRVCTSTCIAGCIIGYNGVSYDMMERTWEDKSFLGGYVIYGFKPDIAVTPSLAILSDQEITDEQWLVTYNASTISYVPTTLGKMFLKNINCRRVVDESKDTGYRVQYDYEIYVEVFAGYEIPWNNGNLLKAGYYHIDSKALMASETCHKLNPCTITEITKADFDQNKSLVASLLSASTAPITMQW